jgi:hypothetical protein
MVRNRTLTYKFLADNIPELAEVSGSSGGVYFDFGTNDAGVACIQIASTALQS